MCTVPIYFDLPLGVAIDEQPCAARIETGWQDFQSQHALCAASQLAGCYSAICERHTPMLLFASLVLCN